MDEIRNLIDVYRETQDNNESSESRPIVTVFGLCCHSIADGVALGCSLFFSSKAASGD